MYLSLETSTQLGTHFQSSHFSSLLLTLMGFLGSSDSKESACNAGDPGLILGSGRSPGEGNGNPLHYSCLDNPMDRGAWQATVHGVTTVGHDSVTKPPPPPLKTLINSAASRGSI